MPDHERSTTDNPTRDTGKPYDRAIAAGWVRLVHSAGTTWFSGLGDDADLVVWDFAWDSLGLGAQAPRARWLSWGPSPAKPEYYHDEDAALTAALAAWGVA